MKTITGKSKTLSAKGFNSYYPSIGGCKPPQSSVRLLPTSYGKPFTQRFKEWWTK